MDLRTEECYLERLGFTVNMLEIYGVDKYEHCKTRFLKEIRDAKHRISKIHKLLIKINDVSEEMRKKNRLLMKMRQQGLDHMKTFKLEQEILYCEANLLYYERS